MNVVVKYAWFSPQTILDIGPGNDDLVFEHCTFMGGKVSVHGEVDRTIFVACLFQGTILARNASQPGSRPIANGRRHTSKTPCRGPHWLCGERAREKLTTGRRRLTVGKMAVCAEEGASAGCGHFDR